jgi:hypothetical protein
MTRQRLSVSASRHGSTIQRGQLSCQASHSDTNLRRMSLLGHSLPDWTASSCPEFAPSGHHAAITKRILSGDKRTWLRPLRKVRAPARVSLRLDALRSSARHLGAARCSALTASNGGAWGIGMGNRRKGRCRAGLRSHPRRRNDIATNWVKRP